MSNKRSRGGVGSKIAYAIIVVFVVFLLLAVGGFFAKYTNGFTSDFATFYVEYDGKTITSDKGGYGFVVGEKYDFKVGYSLDFINKDKLTYNVKVVPNITENTDFKYETADGLYKFSDIEDLTQFFEIEKGENGFTLSTDYTLQKMFTQIYGETVSGVPTEYGSEDYLKLVVSSEDGSKIINLSFNTIFVLPESIVLNKTSLVFW